MLYSEELRLSGLPSQVVVPADHFKVENGGVLIASLVKVDKILSNIKTADVKEFVKIWRPPFNEEQGEILFFKKPQRILSVSINNTAEFYTPGEELMLPISVDGGEPEDEIFVSVVITDESPFS